MISRRRWGARHGRGDATNYTHATRVYVHHSATIKAGINSLAEQKATMLEFERHHVEVNGWDAIAYNFVVFPAFKRRVWHRARVFEGRGLGHIPAAQIGDNAGNVAICIVGNYDIEQIDRRTLDALVKLIKTMPGHFLRGHRDSPAGGTDCPGKTLYARLGELRDRTNRIK